MISKVWILLHGMQTITYWNWITFTLICTPCISFQKVFIHIEEKWQWNSSLPHFYSFSFIITGVQNIVVESSVDVAIFLWRVQEVKYKKKMTYTAYCFRYTDCLQSFCTLGLKKLHRYSIYFYCLLIDNTQDMDRPVETWR